MHCSFGSLDGGPMLEDINHTIISLIPKTKTPESMKEMHSISLCKVTYKLISKVMANRLKKVLPKIIDIKQSAFVPSRLIFDNFPKGFEAFQKNIERQEEGLDGGQD